MITAELIDRLLEATNEAKATVRECHEARRDLKLAMKEADDRMAMKEADDRIGRVRAEVIATVDELATEKTKATFERLDIERISANLKRTLDQWITLLGEANDVLAALQKRAGTL